MCVIKFSATYLVVVAVDFFHSKFHHRNSVELLTRQTLTNNFILRKINYSLIRLHCDFNQLLEI